MDLADKRITGDWIDIRENLHQPQRLRTQLKLDGQRLSLLARDLRQSSLEGVLEVKRRALNAIFSFIGSLARTTPGLDECQHIEGEMRLLIFLCALEGMFAAGILKPVVEKTGLEQPKAKTVPQLFQEVQARLAAEPELKADPHLKNILVDFQLYKKEHEQFSALSPNIPDDRAPQFLANTKARLDAIQATANDHFRKFLQQENQAALDALAREKEQALRVAGLTKLMSVQAQEISRLRSVLLHALQEGIRLRESLLRLLPKKEPVQALLDEELKLLDEHQPGHAMAVKLAKNIATWLEG